MEKGLLCLPERKFSQENGISWKVVQNSQTEFPNGECAPHSLALLVSGLLAWIAFDLIFPEKIFEMERMHLGEMSI